MNNNYQKRAIVLLSGGLDSTTVLAIANFQKYIVHALSFNYGQRHKQELSCAKQIAFVYKVASHHIVDFDLREIGKSALTSDIPVPKNRLGEQQKSIPITYVPARNTIFLSFALALAETLNAQDIFIGANSIDYSGYPDCRPEYIKAYEDMANLATKVGVEGEQKFRIHSPLINLSKAEIIREGIILGVDYSLTHSCYDPSENGFSCGECDSCLLRLKGFDEAGIEDPLTYTKRE